MNPNINFSCWVQYLFQSGNIHRPKIPDLTCTSDLYFIHFSCLRAALGVSRKDRKRNSIHIIGVICMKFTERQQIKSFLGHLMRMKPDH